MTTPDAEDASPSPDYSGDPDGSDMAADQKHEPQADNASPSQKTGSGQKPASNAKDPLRPRRKKARRACFACQRAHLTCGDERPCHRCTKRGLQDTCMDGVRKKAKYLHDAPDGALMPGVGGSYPHMNGGHPAPLLGHESGAVSLPQQAAFYTQAPSGTYYAQNSSQGHLSVSAQDGSPVGAFSNQQTPISPPYSQTNHPSIGSVPTTVSHGPPTHVQQFGGPLFDPSDPALFNFDISSLNFGNHYGALEMGILGHMSSGAADTPPSDATLMNPLNQAAGVYSQHLSYSENPNVAASVSFGADGVPSADWQNIHSRQGSIHMQTPNNTPVTTNIDSHRQDGLHAPHAYAIGQGPSSLSSASPASTDVNAAYDTDNTMPAATFFAKSTQQQAHPRSPNVSRLQQENRVPNSALQPIQYNAVRKRRRDTKWIYDGINKPYDYVTAFHRLIWLVRKRYPAPIVKRVQLAMAKFRPALISAHGDLDTLDLVHQEQALQRYLIQIEELYGEVGVPSLVCRRSGEVVAMNNEFFVLTGWSRAVLLGQKPNMNVNDGVTRDQSSGSSSLTNTTPTMAGQEPDPGQHPASIIELMDERSAVEFLEDFADVAYLASRDTIRRRVNMLRYRTRDDLAKAEEATANAPNGNHAKHEPAIKREGGATIYHETSLNRLAEKDGLVDCMIQWHVKRDNFDMPMLICMHVMPILPTNSLSERRAPAQAQAQP